MDMARKYTGKNRKTKSRQSSPALIVNKQDDNTQLSQHIDEVIKKHLNHCCLTQPNTSRPNYLYTIHIYATRHSEATMTGDTDEEHACAQTHSIQ